MNAMQALNENLLADADTGFAPGIYFGMPEDLYHADAALGSTDIRDLRKDPEAFWKASKLNPNVAERTAYKWHTKATVLGKAMHKMVLEGRAEFEKVYVRRPDDRPGSTAAEKGQLTKTSKAAMLSHQFQLHGDEWDIVERTAELITAHPDLKDALDGGANEVSVFWRRPDGIMCKCRFDRLKPRGIGDLKSIENEMRRKLEVACRNDIAGYRYDIQAEHYLEGRAQMAALAAVGAVFMCSVHGEVERATKSNIVGADKCLALVRECAATDIHQRDQHGSVYWSNCDGEVDGAEGDRYAFQFIFVQKSSPGVWSCVVSPGSDILQIARMHIEEAFATYLTLAKVVPAGKPWPAQWRVRELAIEELPAYYGRE